MEKYTENIPDKFLLVILCHRSLNIKAKNYFENTSKIFGPNSQFLSVRVDVESNLKTIEFEIRLASCAPFSHFVH